MKTVCDGICVKWMYHMLLIWSLFQVGTEESPFQHTARITLHGSVRDPEIPIYGAKVSESNCCNSASC